jgi:hypothetical protein
VIWNSSKGPTRLRQLASPSAKVVYLAATSLASALSFAVVDGGRRTYATRRIPLYHRRKGRLTRSRIRVHSHRRLFRSYALLGRSQVPAMACMWFCTAATNPATRCRRMPNETGADVASSKRRIDQAPNSGPFWSEIVSVLRVSG